MSQNLVVVIAGPTASGKSQLAIDVALELNGVIVNADASQVYKGIPIIAASPSPQDKNVVEHRLYEYVDNNVNGNVVNWLNDAVSEIRKIWNEGKVPIVVGGSGMYIDNLINGTTPIPEVTAEIRSQAMALLEAEGIDSLYERLKQADVKAAQMLNPKDTTRVRRAYEIFLQTGISIADWYQQPMQKKIPEANFYVIKLLPPKSSLDERCDLRFGKMIENGVLEELKKLSIENLPVNLPVMRAQGVPELMAFIWGKITLPEAIEAAKLHTRQYAKRQITWFKNKLKADITFAECYLGQKEIVNSIKKQLHKNL